MSKITIAEALGEGGIDGFNAGCRRDGSLEEGDDDHAYDELVELIEKRWREESLYPKDWLDYALMDISA